MVLKENYFRENGMCKREVAMILSTILHLGSIILGLVAWIVPFLAFNNLKKAMKHMFISFSACTASLCLQFFEINNRVQIRDWSALMDTIGVLKWVVVTLVVITFILNLMVLAAYFEEKT